MIVLNNIINNSKINIKFPISNERWGEIQLFGAVLFFGVSFTYQKLAMMDGLGPVSYNACRYSISTLFLYLLRLFVPKIKSPQKIDNDIEKEHLKNPEKIKNIDYSDNLYKNIWIWAAACGIANFGGSVLQQIGLVTVSAAKTGFITGMYVVFVPIMEFFIPGMGFKLNYKSWIAAVISLIGLYLLSGCAEQEICIGGAIRIGEVIVFFGMLFWASSIIVADYGAKNFDAISLTLNNFFITTLLTIAFALLFEGKFWIYPFPFITRNWFSIVFVGFNEAAAFYLSTLGQKYISASKAALIYSLEAVFCALFAFLLIKESLTPLEIFGCILMTLSALVTSIYSSVDEPGENDNKFESVQMANL